MRDPKKSRPFFSASSDSREDTRNLLNHLGTDPGSYREFSEPESENATQFTENVPTRAEEFIAPSPHAFPRAMQRERYSAASGPPARAPPSVTSTEPASPEMASSGRAYRMLQQFSGERRTIKQAPTSTRTKVVGLVSHTGGVGKSTLTAALGESLAADGVNCVLVGQTRHSPLLYYFGGPDDNSDLVADDIVNHRRSSRRSDQPMDLLIGDVPPDELLAQVAARDMAPQLVLLDLEASPSSHEYFGFMDIVLVPLRPDVNSLLAIERMEAEWNAFDDKPEGGLWYVMNQFDAARNLHTQVRNAARERLGQRLLPFTLPLDNGVQEALASGEPPQAYDAHSPFSLSVGELAAWLSAQARVA